MLLCIKKQQFSGTQRGSGRKNAPVGYYVLLVGDAEASR